MTARTPEFAPRLPRRPRAALSSGPMSMLM